jgi:1,4-dihydroxy-2-naphthoyl-CoA hydrolase
MAPSNWLQLERAVRFGDTDAAGVMHFHQLLRWCHEAWEESLERYGIAASAVFPGAGPGVVPTDPDAGPAAVALPIIHCQADYLRPIHCGDRLRLDLEPRRLDPMAFEVSTRFQRDGAEVARGLIRHLAITSVNRRRCTLPEPIQRWLEASALGAGVQPL